MTAPKGDAQAGRMEGGGFYTEHSEEQGDYGRLAFEWLAAAAAAVPSPAPLPFVIADMGCAGGGNSLAPVATAIAARPADEQVLVAHTDIPSNDFAPLFRLVESDLASYRDERTSTVVVGRSFYERLLPQGFLSLGWSSIAVHWLSAVPEPIRDHIYCSFATGSAREALRAQAESDWHNFLDNRVAELRPGGRLLVLGGSCEDDGTSGAEGLMEIADEALRELLDAGRISRAEYERITIPTWNRTIAEFRAPFEEDRFAGELTLRRSALRWLEDHYLTQYRDDGDLDAYVASVSGFFRAAFEQSLLAGLDEGRNPDSVSSVAEELRAAIERGIRSNPERAACRWHVAILEIERH